MVKGILYLVAFMDWYFRRVLTWRVSNTLDREFCVAALQNALARYWSTRDSTTMASNTPQKPSPACSRPTASPSACDVDPIKKRTSLGGQTLTDFAQEWAH
jgi:hypothetical protein